MVKKGIHKRLLENIEDNSGEGGNDKITATSAIALSRILDSEVTDYILNNNGLDTI